MGPTLVYPPLAENHPHLLKSFPAEATSTTNEPGWTTPKPITPQASAQVPYPLHQSITEEPTQPDIEWDPSLETYLARVERLAKLGETLPQTVPEGFPTVIQSARAWDGADFAGNESAYVYTLTDDDVEEVDQALAIFIKQSNGNPDPEMITPETFLLPNLGKKLIELAEIIHNGQGFYVIRALDPDYFDSSLEKILAYVGITSYLGETKACQDAGGSRLLHIKDRGMAFPGAEMRQAPYSNVGQPFHTDACDLLIMYVNNLAHSGGKFQLASSAQIYNSIASARPDVIHTLSSDTWIFDKFTPHLQPPYEIRPILLPFGEKQKHGPSFFYSRRPLTGSPVAPRTTGIPAMTERQAEALDMVHFTAVGCQLKFEARRGDVVCVNNLAVMHAREGFTDFDDKRHIIRLWLRNKRLEWPKPEIIRPVLDLKYDTRSEWCKRPVWHLDPPTVPERLLARRFTCS
ncbi:Clavaminate synthase-like protein [Rhypophila decipiens]|uniref:Clavaminate synthase-like protein n=1 Tax=Rhypophila decipiens TaxID=261697 RepID=A0AAN7B9W9_9PEZI|nr:Clavaminate synthase-like protein [Rhypophila decipiens]